MVSSRLLDTTYDVIKLTKPKNSMLVLVWYGYLSNYFGCGRHGNVTISRNTHLLVTQDYFLHVAGYVYWGSRLIYKPETYCQLWAFGLYNSILLDLPLKREKTLAPMYRTAMMIRGKINLGRILNTKPIPQQTLNRGEMEWTLHVN